MRKALLLLLLLAPLPALADESAWHLLEQGVKAIQAKDLVRAQALLEAAQRKDAACHDAAYYLGRIHAEKGRLREAAAELKTVPKEHSLFPLAQAELGQVLLKQGKKKEALACLLTSARMRASANMWIQVASVQIDLALLKEASASLDEAEKLVKGDYRLVEMRGRLYVEMKKYPEALAQYDKLVEKFVEDYTLHNMRALCLLEMHRPDAAARAFEKVLQLYPYHQGALRGLIGLWEDDSSKAARVAELRAKLERIEKNPPTVRKVKRAGR